MAHKIIIDGYNMLHLVTAYQSKMAIGLESAREQLITDLQIYQGFKKVEIWLVFDGSAEIPVAWQQKNYAGIYVIYSRPPRKADKVIMDIIRAEKRKRRIIVVTDDGEIKSFARSAGSHTLSPRTLYQRLKTQSQERDYQNKFARDMTPEELDEWKDIFGID